MRDVVAVACSGGRDSSALLHATAVAARDQGLRVLALHVHHGLQPEADAWYRHVSDQCAAWAQAGLPVAFAGHRLTGSPAPGDSIEAWARQGRYDALTRLARAGGATAVLLGHHRRDQAETFLLQALRGGGMAGLSAMPAHVERDGIVWLRPWLDRSRDSIDRYVARHGLVHVDDGSNLDGRFARNRLRHAVWPALHDAFPDAEGALAAAARWAQQAQRILVQVADQDLQACATGTTLRCADWVALGPDRAANALRAWLQRQLGVAPSATLVTRLLHELPGAGPAEWPLAHGVLRRYRGRLSWQAATPVAALPAALEDRLRITRAGRYRLPGWQGEVVATRVRSGGIALAWLAHLELRPRLGGERFQAGFDRPARSLKKQYQAAGVPEWERGGPLVFSGGQLLFVPGLGIDARVVALPGQSQLALHWRRALAQGA